MSQHLEGKNLLELLDMLVPVPEPATVSLMPQTPGWAMLGLFLAALVFWSLRNILKRHRANAYRRAALAELSLIQTNASEIATLLRRTALAAFPREQVAGLTGEKWLNFLNQSYGGKEFSGPQGQTLLSAPYRQDTQNADLADLARRWITQHSAAHS